MARLLNKVFDFIGGWEEEEEEILEQKEEHKDLEQPNFLNAKGKQNKVVNIHSNSQFKVVVMQPESINDAQDVCEHLKDKKPVVVNLEDVEKESAQRIVDFLSGSVYALDGNIQRVSGSIFLVVPCNVDIMGEFSDRLKNKTEFPWMK